MCRKSLNKIITTQRVKKGYFTAARAKLDNSPTFIPSITYFFFLRTTQSNLQLQKNSSHYLVMSGQSQTIIQSKAQSTKRDFHENLKALLSYIVDNKN